MGSWFISPVLSGIVSSGIFYTIRKLILKKRNPIEPGLRSLPVFYGMTLFINVLSILLGGPDSTFETCFYHVIVNETLGILKNEFCVLIVFKIQVEGLPDWTQHFFAILISGLIGVIVAAFVYLFMVPRLRRAIAGTDICYLINYTNNDVNLR